MKRMLAVLLLVVLVLTGCKKAGPDTANSSNGTHNFYRGDTADWPFDRKITFQARWTRCKWMLQMRKDNGPWDITRTGTQKNFLYIVFVDGRDARIIVKNCGKTTVNRDD